MLQATLSSTIKSISFGPSGLLYPHQGVGLALFITQSLFHTGMAASIDCRTTLAVPEYTGHGADVILYQSLIMKLVSVVVLLLHKDLITTTYSTLKTELGISRQFPE